MDTRRRPNTNLVSTLYNLLGYPRCRHCGKHYWLGVTGTADGCDACLGIERDRKGRAWLPDETEQVFESGDGGEITVARADAFAEV
jgi:hypothetical protein